MPDRLHIVTAAPRLATLDGRDYRVSRFGPREYGEMRQWLADNTPDPRTVARGYMEGLPESVQIHIWDQALAASKDWPPRLSDPSALERLFTEPAGQALLVYLALRKTTADFNLAAASALAERLGEDDLTALWKLVTPEPAALPKDEAEIQAPSTSPTATATPTGT